METAFFLTIISVCPFSLGNCYSEENWTHYISVQYNNGDIRHNHHPEYE